MPTPTARYRPEPGTSLSRRGLNLVRRVGRSVGATKNQGGWWLPKVTCTKTLRLTTTPGKC